MANEFRNQANFKYFCSHYHKKPIILYVGAGISMSNDSEYGLPNWIGLLNTLGKEIAGIQSPNLPPHPWDAADYILKLCTEYIKSTGYKSDNPEQEAERRLQKALWEIIRRQKNCITQGKKHPYKLLNKEYLKTALTLRSIAAFSALPISKSHNADIYRFGSNPRVRAIVTGNYDPYLESAATSMFKIAVTKPVAAFGSTAGTLREVPVHHVHGYVPHPGQKVGAQKPLLEQLVLTRRSYDRAWREKDAFCSTMISQIYLLRHYVTLFIGFSFTDPKIKELLCKIWNEYPKEKQKIRWNYTIMKKGSDQKKRFFSQCWRKILYLVLYEHGSLKF